MFDDDVKEALKSSARLCVEQQAERIAEAKDEVDRRKQSNAAAVASTIKLLRVDDEALEETQRIAKQSRTFATALYDERGNTRYSSTFTQYKNPIDDSESLWWPWGSTTKEQNKVCTSLDKMVTRARMLRSRIKQAVDSHAAALEAGVAFAQAAAAAHPSRRGKDSSSLRRRTTKEASNMAADLEEEARGLFRVAARHSNERLILRRATDAAVIKEAVRRRSFMKPAQKDEDVELARRLHARKLAAERRRQRTHQAEAYLALFRDSMRSKGLAGYPTTRAVEPDVEVLPLYLPLIPIVSQW